MDTDGKITDNQEINQEEKLENTLRPQCLDDFIGQQKLKDNLKVFIEASKKRHEPLDHCLFYAPPGLGKTTLAHIIAKETGGNLRTTSGPVLERVGDLAAILTNLSEGDIFFIDEIHRMNHLVEESLYPVMEDFELDIIIGQGPSAKTIKLPVPKFTLVGATTRAGMLSSPLRDRFGIIEHLNFYNENELVKIVKRSGIIMKVEIDEDGAFEIAKRSRGTPRIVNRLLRRVRDFAEIKTGGKINKQIAMESLDLLGVDEAGLDKMDRLLLSTMIEKFDGGPVGIDTIAVSISEDADTISDVYEPFLIQSGFIARTPRGRIATESAYKHFGLKIPANKQKELF
ncbi:MAG: Holliday junction branch migration DNA helicase RuvB [Endomicrobiaceae bacterium]|jgi:Holliday junction DNA helicase RuvB|nr:Holliday junction branch migration DNA helicase RuvB [Endomicrobiaceae bacterium]MDD3729642.1 Holliday junction branch migration DNA helicase RuvB [Endomicrobiaceae bacterium]MDD4165876.1 Holliday junction branch migration DNA helicase RuvB [Endomicrobiaceae bacterium]